MHVCICISEFSANYEIIAHEVYSWKSFDMILSSWNYQHSMSHFVSWDKIMIHNDITPIIQKYIHHAKKVNLTRDPTLSSLSALAKISYVKYYSHIHPHKTPSHTAGVCILHYRESAIFALISKRSSSRVHTSSSLICWWNVLLIDFCKNNCFCIHT